MMSKKDLQFVALLIGLGAVGVLWLCFNGKFVLNLF